MYKWSQCSTTAPLFKYYYNYIIIYITYNKWRFLEWGDTWLGDALIVKQEGEERAEARRQEHTSSSGHPHGEARLSWRSPRLLVAPSTRFIRAQPAEDARLPEETQAQL